MSAADDLLEERFSKASHELWWTQPKTSFDRLAAATRVAIIKGCELRAVADEESGAA